MEFRASPYIDFNSGTVIKDPMHLSSERPSPRSLEDMLDLFECRVDVWQLGPAVQILKKIEEQPLLSPSVWAHTAYALLAVIVPYFEMIGKILNPKSKARGSAGPDFNYGFCDVYPAFDIANGVRTDKALPDVVGFRDRLRNGLYHLGYTKGNLFIHNEPQEIPGDFFVDKSKPEHVSWVNPHQMTRTIMAHFPILMGRLRDLSEHDLRDKFEVFFKDFHGLH